MAKITKKASIIEALNNIVFKEAELAQTNISGTPGKDTKVTSVSESTETTDQNNVGPDKLNGEQGYKQEPAKDESEPLKGAKQAAEASSVDKLAADILGAIQTKLAANAQTNISGQPGKDTNITSVSDSAETTDQNNVGPEKLNKEQGYEQKPTSDKSEPLKGAKKASDESVKEASHKLGAAVCEIILKKMAENQGPSEQELLKEAGRRDFDTLISQAAAEFETQQAQAAEQEKIAEAQGAAAFEELLKQAQYEALVEENNTLRTKLAEYEAKEQQALAKEAAAKEEARFSKMAELVFEKLKNELTNTSVAIPTK